MSQDSPQPQPPGPPPVPFYPPPPPPPRRGNGAAIASLIFGILGCIPEITGLLAILFGIIGLRRARNPYVGGKGLAGAGLALGVLSVVLWSIALGAMGMAGLGSEPARAVARQYFQDLDRQDINAVMNASTSPVTGEDARKLARQLQRLGHFQDARFTGIYFSYHNGVPQYTLSGIARYANAEAPFTIILIRQQDQWKVQGFHINSRLLGHDSTPDTVEVNRGADVPIAMRISHPSAPNKKRGRRGGLPRAPPSGSEPQDRRPEYRARGIDAERGGPVPLSTSREKNREAGRVEN